MFKEEAIAYLNTWGLHPLWADRLTHILLRKKIRIVTDSKSAVQYMESNAENNEPSSNIEEAIHQSLERMYTAGQTITLVWCPGHCKIDRHLERHHHLCRWKPPNLKLLFESELKDYNAKKLLYELFSAENINFSTTNTIIVECGYKIERCWFYPNPQTKKQSNLW